MKVEWRRGDAPDDKKGFAMNILINTVAIVRALCKIEKKLFRYSFSLRKDRAYERSIVDETSRDFFRQNHRTYLGITRLWLNTA